MKLKIFGYWLLRSEIPTGEWKGLSRLEQNYVLSREQSKLDAYENAVKGLKNRGYKVSGLEKKIAYWKNKQE